METRVLINSVKKMYPVITFLKDRYFPDGRVFYSEKALVESKKKGKKVAPFVVPVVGGIAMEKDGYNAYEIEAPFIAPKMPVTAADLAAKAFGESPESGRSPESRQNEVVAEHVDDLRNSIYRRFEEMSGEIITTGKVVMEHYANANDAATGTNPIVMQLQYFNDTFDNRYIFGTKAFSAMTAEERLNALFDAAAVLRGRGVHATDLVMTGDVSQMLFTDKDFMQFYDIRRFEAGEINPKELPSGVVYNGSLNINGVIFALFTYDETFEDLDGTVKPIFPKGTIAFLTPGLGTTVYSQVTFVKGNQFVSYAEKIVPRQIADEQNNMLEVQAFSRPVPYPLDWEGWLVANAYMITEAGIDALSTKADVIAYAKSIGLTSLSDSDPLSDLKAAVKAYQAAL